MYIKKTLATIVTILAGISLIMIIAGFIMEINNFKGFAALYYGPFVLLIAVVFAILGTAIIHEVKVAINAHRAKVLKQANEDIAE